MSRVDRAIEAGRCALAVSGSILRDPEVMLALSERASLTPMALMLQAADATVTVAHSRTHHLPEVTRDAEILVVAAGRTRLIGARHVRPGAVVVDVGIHRQEGRLCGDVDHESVEPLAAAITPVPGGVGPMTVAMLLVNTVLAWCERHGLDTGDLADLRP